MQTDHRLQSVGSQITCKYKDRIIAVTSPTTGIHTPGQKPNAYEVNGAVMALFGSGLGPVFPAARIDAGGVPSPQAASREEDARSASNEFWVRET